MTEASMMSEEALFWLYMVGGFVLSVLCYRLLRDSKDKQEGDDSGE